MSKNLTWLKPSGEWGIEGVDLAALPPAVYGALAKLMRLEHPFRGHNPPLTLEELREIDGEPVWLDCSAFPEYSGYHIIEKVSEKTLTFLDGLLIRLYDCGKGWLAYRRKPEEGAT